MSKTNFKGIPKELKELHQWVCFDVEGSKKIPYIPGTGSMAASNRPSDWRSYAAAKKDVAEGRRQYLGFCFSSSDPYTFIDMDDPDDDDQVQIFERLGTYWQHSLSGRGVHLICRGSFEGAGKHPSRPKAGIFKENRFCLMTGDHDGETTIKVVADADLQRVHAWLSNGGVPESASDPLVEYEADIPDATVIEMGLDRFDKFGELCNGNWEQFEEYHNDHSTADHAFVSMLCDLTKSNAQVRYLFGISGMWNAERAEKKAAHGGRDNYLDRSIRKQRTKQAMELEAACRNPIQFGPVVEYAPVAEEEFRHGQRDLLDSLPKGLIRDIAEYSYRTSYLPLQEASLCAGLMLMSGICGRGFLTPTNSGLNLWLVLVGGTSCGKDEYQQGLKRLIHAVGKDNRNIRTIFGGEVVSGPGLETTFQETPRYISYVPEFGDTFKSLANPNAPDYVRSLTRGMLNSFNSAGRGGSSEGRRKAQGSDEKTYVERPCLCVAGEATPESLYGGMSSRELSTGFLQRFILLDVPASSWSLEENPHHAASPPKDLVERLSRLCLLMDARDQQGRFTVVPASPAAEKLLKDYRDGKRLQIMRCPQGLAVKEVMNRAGLKALRLATLLAVSADYDQPKITEAHARWAIDFVERTDRAVLDRFTTGDIGAGQVKQESDIMRAASEIAGCDEKTKRRMGFSTAMIEGGHFILYQTLKERVVNLPSFSSDRAGAVNAFERCVQNLDTSGRLVRLSKEFACGTLAMGRGQVLCVNG